MAKHLVLVAGNIGAGKTSLTERMGQRLGWRSAYESVADNPYLADFYGEMHAWAFHLQIFFLGHRADQYLQAARDPRSAILDRSIYEDFHIFTRALHHMGNMAERDYLSYHRLFDLVVGSLPRPDLLIYLGASFPVSTARRRLDWQEREYQEQLRRLAHARDHAHLFIDTDNLTPDQVLQKALAFLESIHK